jgi:hypothetical protein
MTVRLRPGSTSCATLSHRLLHHSTLDCCTPTQGPPPSRETNMLEERDTGPKKQKQCATAPVSGSHTPYFEAPGLHSDH